MLKRFIAGDAVGGGFYFNLDDWTMHVAPRQGDVLPGEPGARYMAFPTLAVLVAAPALSLAFVMFLPFIGIALVTKATIDRLWAVGREVRAARPAHEVRPRVWK